MDHRVRGNTLVDQPLQILQLQKEVRIFGLEGLDLIVVNIYRQLVALLLILDASLNKGPS